MRRFVPLFVGENEEEAHSGTKKDHIHDEVAKSVFAQTDACIKKPPMLIWHDQNSRGVV